MPRKLAWNLTDATRQRIVELRKDNLSAREILVALQKDDLLPKTATERGMRYHLNALGMGGHRAPSAHATGSRPQQNKKRDHRIGTKFEPLWTPAADRILEREWNKGAPTNDTITALQKSGSFARRAKLNANSVYSRAFKLRKLGRPIISRNSMKKSAAPARSVGRPILDVPIPALGRIRRAPDDAARIPITLTAAQAARLVELLLRDKE